MSHIPPTVFAEVFDDASRVIHQAFHDSDELTSLSVQLINGFIESDENEGRELWGFHCMRIDNLTGDSHRVIGGLMYRVQFGIRSLQQFRIYGSEQDAAEFNREFESVRICPAWADIRYACRRIGELSVFVIRALIARSLRYMRQQRRAC
jgi:hypothetical protein